MSIVSLVSFSGAPGVTTLALATAAALTTSEVPEPVLVEAATSGGVVGGWYDLPAEPGLSTLALAIGGDEPPDLLAHAQEVPGGLPAVLAPPSGSRVAKLLFARGQALAAHLQGADATVVVDCGRISVETPLRPLLQASILVGVAVRPTREDFRLAATALAELNTVLPAPLPAGWILVGASPWSVDEIGTQYGLPVLATVPEDRPGADGVAGRRRLRRHAPLSRSVQSFADDITKHLRVATAADPMGYLNQATTTAAATADAASTESTESTASTVDGPADPAPGDDASDADSGTEVVDELSSASASEAS